MKYESLPQWSKTLLIAVSLTALLSGCNSTRIQSTRSAAALTADPFRNVVVVGMDERPEVRNPFENDVARLLREHGVEGTGSHTRFSLSEMKGDKEQIRQRLLAARAESVLFVRVTDRADFVEGPATSLGTSVEQGSAAEYPYSAFPTPGSQINTALRLGVRLYRVSDGALIWSGLVDTIMKEDADSTVLLRRMAKTIVDRLAKDKVIP